MAPIRPPRLEDENSKSLGLSLELSKRPVPDGDLDVSVDLGEAVARTSALTPRPKSRPSSPMQQLEYLSLARDATFAPAVGARQPGEWKKWHFLHLCFHTRSYFFFFFFQIMSASTAAAGIAPTISEPALGPSSRHQAVTVKNRSGPAAPPKPYTTAEAGSKGQKRKKGKKMKPDEIDEIFS